MGTVLVDLSNFLGTMFILKVVSEATQRNFAHFFGHPILGILGFKER